MANSAFNAIMLASDCSQPWPRQLSRAYHLPAQTLASRRRVLGNDHPATLNSMDNLATVRPELEGLQP